MNVTSKSRHALQIMLDLQNQKGNPKKEKSIIRKHKISPNYMNKIIFKLKIKTL